MSRNTTHASRVLCLLLGAPALASLGCATHVNDILSEAKKGDPESVKEAVVELGAALAEKEAREFPYDAADEEAVLYLKDVATKSSDHLNRAGALASLAGLKRPELTDVFLGALEDRHWIVQMEAARGLAARPDPRAAGPLARRLEVEEQMEVRLAIIKALAATGGDESLKALLVAFLDRSNRWKHMRHTTYEAVRALSGREFRLENERAWQAYFAERFPEKPAAPDPGAAGDPAPRGE
jgi:HEAT repeat protein